ncbi:MAG: hypothetical protein EOP05_08795 [Proteobacteria bacterium]|nr:MAG: hypothetical protein EOP05_08795 [Pseudomonadota bacterium]
MSLSIKGLSELQSVLKGDHPGFKLVVLLDPDADQIEAEKAAQKQKWDSAYLERNKSTTLLKSGSKIHFPNYVFFSAGKIESHLIAGYKSQPAFERLLRKYK